MALKAILLDLVGAAAASAAAAAAVLAREHGARIEALHVSPPPDMPVGAIGRAASVVPLGAAHEAARREARRVRRFLDAPPLAGLDIGWTSVEGEVAEVLGGMSRFADLAVVAAAPEDDTVDDLVRAALAPLLVVPAGSTMTAPPRRILIAFDGSRESVRAVRGALPLLAKAAEIGILTVGEDEAEVEVGRRLVQYLGHHGLAAKRVAAPEDECSVGEAILKGAAHEGSELLVMGAFGHAPLVERLLGGATRHVLRHLPLPVLLAR